MGHGSAFKVSYSLKSTSLNLHTLTCALFCYIAFSPGLAAETLAKARPTEMKRFRVYIRDRFFTAYCNTRYLSGMLIPTSHLLFD